MTYCTPSVSPRAGQTLWCEACKLPIDLNESRVCQAANICIYRGEQVRKEVCESCGEGVRLKIFSCSLYKECTPAKLIVGVRCCSDCEDFTKAH